MEFVGLGFGGTSHTGQLFVHAEIVLNGDGGKRLGLGLDLDLFLGLQRLVQPVVETAARHQAAGVLVHNHDLALLDDIMNVALEQAVGLEQLRKTVQPLALVTELLFELGALFAALQLGKGSVGIEFVNAHQQVRHHERAGIVGRNRQAAAFGKVGRLPLFVDHEIERALHLLQHTLVGVAADT
ncbi:hypothetical protein SDC9_131678 [bioreactor metagenome]|uniref:Uncharacterized protein n=1 Tax=bioreactor metagenome TaxID=1076179 RepID=A0A645D5W9_9ZZZZ